MTNSRINSFFHLCILSYLGIVATISLKTILLGSFSSRNFSGFYRTKPFAHNLVTIALECWHLQLTLFAVVSRFVKLLVVIILYLGRFDRPILMDDICETYL